MSLRNILFPTRITRDAEICHGRTVIRGLRYPVDSILEYLAAGDSFEDLLAEFPDLERDDLNACVEFAKLQMPDALRTAYRLPTRSLEVLEGVDLTKLAHFDQDP